MPISNPGAGKSIATGSYTGNQANDRQIITGFKCSKAIVMSEADGSMAIAIPDAAIHHMGTTHASTDADKLLLHATNGFIVYPTGGSFGQINANAVVYHYWAISE